jgi:translation initiation factor IF-1
MVDNKIVLDGIVIEDCRGEFRIKINDNHIVRARLSGKIRTAGIRIVPNDRVQVEVSEYDLSKGRIIFRYRE